MNAVAWAIIWVAVFFSPEIHYVAYGRDPPQAAQTIAVLIWVIVTIILVRAALHDSDGAHARRP